MGAKALKVKKLLGGDVATWDFEEVKACGKKLFCVAVNKFAAREELFNRKQQSGEPVAEYAVMLQSLAESCDFVSNKHADLSMKDRFLSGLADRNMKMKLYEKSDTWTFKKTVDEALLIETLQRSVNHVVQPTPSSSVNYTERKGGKTKKQPDKKGDKNSAKKKFKGTCNGCGKVGHKKKECKSCFKCRKYGHFAKDCREAGDSANNQMTSSDLERIFVDQIFNDEQGKIYLPVSFLGSSFRFECDTGAIYSIIGAKLIKDLGNIELRKPPVSISSASGHDMKIRGYFEPVMELNGKRAKVTLLVTDEDYFNAILGTRALDVLLPQWREGFRPMCNAVGVDIGFMESVKRRFGDVFSESDEPAKVVVGLKMRESEPDSTGVGQPCEVGVGTHGSSWHLVPGGGDRLGVSYSGRGQEGWRDKNLYGSFSDHKQKSRE